MLFFISFILSFGLSLVLTYAVGKLALKKGVVDMPDGGRKKHSKPTPLLGGVSIYGSLVVTICFLLFFDGALLGGFFSIKHVFGLLLAAGILVIGGVVDDIKDLRPWQQFFFPVCAVLVIVASGIGIDYITNPFGETFDLTLYKIELFSFNAIPYYFVILADIFALIWLLGTIYTTKILDGVDGLVGGLTVIASISIFVLSMDERVLQPETALISLVVAGSFLGFLVFNFHPAKIFLGEAGSTLAGFLVGVLAILSGGKLATALLILSIPIVDLAFVIIERLVNGQSPFKTADTKHLHFRLRELGLSVRKTVLLMYSCAIILGYVALKIEGKAKVITLIFLSFASFIVLVSLSLYLRKKKAAF